MTYSSLDIICLADIAILSKGKPFPHFCFELYNHLLSMAWSTGWVTLQKEANDDDGDDSDDK